MSADSSLDDVDVIDPPSRTLQFGGRELQVHPMTVGKIPAVTRALRGMRLEATDAAGIMELVAEHGDQVLQAAAHATGLPLEEIQAASLPDFVELFAAVLEVNSAFFTRAVTRLQAAFAQPLGGGRTSSTGSSTPATDSPISASTP